MFLFSLLSHSKYRPAAAWAAVLLLLAASLPAFADEITIDDSPDMEEQEILFPEETADFPDGAFIEDAGADYDLTDGISMEDLEEETQEITELVEEIDLIDADPERIRAHLEKLLETDSPTGAEGELTIASYIGSEMKALGYTVSLQRFHEGFVNINGIDAPGVNVLAERGADSKKNRTRDIFLVVTHYDSKTFPEQTDSASEEASVSSEKDPYSNDKSGAAVLLETARILASVETDTDLCFLFLSGQEDGGYGAKAFLESLSDENRSRIRGVLSVDRVGYDTGMPNVIKTLTGEANQIASLVQECGVWQEAGLILQGERPIPEIPEETEDDAEDAGSEDGQVTVLLESASTLAGDVTEPQDGIPMTENPEEDRKAEIPSAWSCLSDPYAAPEDADPVTEPVRNSIQSIFANAQIPSALITQYVPETDLVLYRQTKELGLADTTADDLLSALTEIQNDGIYEDIATFNDVEIVGLDISALGTSSGESEPEDLSETETEAEKPLPSAEPVLLARIADVTAEALASIMET